MASTETVARSLRGFLGVPTVTAEAAGRVVRALQWYEESLHFADALHLASATEAGAERLATFDSTFRRHAESQGTAVRVITP